MARGEWRVCSRQIFFKTSLTEPWTLNLVPLAFWRNILMDKKIKKKSHVLQQRIQALRQQLAGAKKQMDDPNELKSIEQQLASAEAELARIKDS